VSAPLFDQLPDGTEGMRGGLGAAHRHRQPPVLGGVSPLGGVIPLGKREVASRLCAYGRGIPRETVGLRH